MLKRFLCMLLLMVSLCSAALAEQPVIDRINTPGQPWPFAEDAQLLEIWFPQMTDCDAAVLRLGGKTWVIDCATEKYGARLVELLDALGVERIETVYNTHPHHDHINGFLLMAGKYDVGELAVCFPTDYNDVMIAAVSAAEAAGVPVTSYATGDRFDLNGAELEVYMTGRTDWNLNNQSAMMWLRYGEATMLFTADLEQKAQKYIAQTLPEGSLKVDVLKYPHHGLKKLSRFFVEAVDPAFSVVTSNGRVYEVRYDMGFHNIAFVMTMTGYVRLTTDGQTWVADLFEAEQLPGLTATAE